MLRVLHCIYDDVKNPWIGGGGAVRAFELYRRLTGRVDATIVSGNFPGAQDEVIDGVEFVRMGRPRPYPWSRWTYARAASRLLAKAEYDVGIFDFSVYTPIRLPGGRPVGMVVHMPIGPTARQRWGNALGSLVEAVEHRLLRQAQWVCPTSRWACEQIRPHTRADARFRIVGSGVPDEFFDVDRHEQDFIMYYGRFDIFQKGLDTLFEAFAELRRRFPELTLVVAGRGKDANRLPGLARAFGIEDGIRLIIDVTPEERRRLFSGARLLLMPSRFEGLAMVPAEAMAAGIPVVASDVGALNEVVDPPSGGTLIVPEDPSGLASAAGQLLRSPERRAELTRTARASAQRFRWRAVAEAHLDFLKTVAAGAGGEPDR